ncbi:MAG TPA: hypothetical protein VI894_00855 [Candidatus Nanoarchaeia archaeon]|nr:hypothetical protein [Candidatus Nanoarchaeia archaeon]
MSTVQELSVPTGEILGQKMNLEQRASLVDSEVSESHVLAESESHVLADVFSELDKVIEKYSGYTLDQISQSRKEIMKDADVVKIRKKLYDFSSDVQSSIIEFRNLVLEWCRENLKATGRGQIEAREYAMLESICHEEHMYHDRYKDWVLGKATVDKRQLESSGNLEEALKKIELSYADLIYSHHQEEIKQGKLICLKDGSSGELYYVGRLIVARELVACKQNLEKEIISSVSKKLGMKSSEVRRNLEKAIEGKGYSSLYEWLEQTRTCTIDLKDFNLSEYFENGKREKITTYLEEESQKIPLPEAALIERIKDASLADKVLLVRYLHKHPHSNGVKRDLYDVGGLRMILFDDASKCYEAKEWFEKKAGDIGFDVTPDDKIKGKQGEYQSIHLDFINVSTGVCFEVQIRTNEMDNAAETDYRQSHQNHRLGTHHQIESLVRAGVVNEKEVLLTRLILTPTSKRAYNRLSTN